MTDVFCHKGGKKGGGGEKKSWKGRISKAGKIENRRVRTHGGRNDDHRKDEALWVIKAYSKRR